MNNQELELRIKNILSIENFFDMMEEVVSFEKEYKTTNFYKKTKLPLIEVVKNTKVWYTIQLKDLGSKIQNIINELDFTKINGILDQFGSVYGQENADILNIIKEFKDIVK